MTIKTYFSSVIGSGTESDPYRLAVSAHPVTWTGEIVSDAETGAPLSYWVPVTVDADDEAHAALMADEHISVAE